MTSTPSRAVTRLRIVIAVALAMVASSLAPAAGTAFAQSALYPGAVGLVADTGGEPVLLRETPSFDAAVLTSLSAGTPADILDGPVYSEDGVAWQPVSVAGMTGYVVAGYLIDGGQAAASPDVVELAQEAAPVEAVPVEAAPETAAAETMAVETAPAETLPAPAASPSEVPANPVTTADLNLRVGPSLAAPVLTVIPAGAALAPTGEWSQGFVGVTYEGNYGWVDSGWVAAGEPEADTAPRGDQGRRPAAGGGPRPGDGGGARANQGCRARRRPLRGARRERLCGGCRQPACWTVRKQRGLARPPAGRPGDDHRRAERWLDAGLVQRHHRLHQRQSPLRVHDNAAIHGRARQPGAADGAGYGAASPRTRLSRAAPESWRRPRSAMSTCAERRRRQPR